MSSPSRPPAADTPAPGAKAPNARGRGTLIVAVVVLVYAALFLLLNRQAVTVHFVFFSTRIGLIWALALAGGAGIIIGLLAARRRAAT